VLNIYALMSSDVFVPLAILPGWSAVFIVTSPFYNINPMLQHAFRAPIGSEVAVTGVNLSALGLGLICLFGARRLFVAFGRAR